MPSDRYFKYLDQCKIHHVTKKTFSGNGCLKHARALIAFSGEIMAQSALDYGCGKGLQYGKLIAPFGEGMGGAPRSLEAWLTFEVDKYDPAVKGFHKTDLTYPRDLVWCTDVLEHIPEEDIPFIVSELLRLSSKGLFVTVGTYPAKKHLPNGENAHVCIKPFEWWTEQFAPAFQRAADASDAQPFKFQLLCE